MNKRKDQRKKKKSEKIFQCTNIEEIKKEKRRRETAKLERQEERK